MPRQKISEYRAKQIVSSALGVEYHGYTEGTLDKADPDLMYVVKVDQAVKKRFKKGLVFLDVSYADIPAKIKTLKKKGYESYVIEPYIQHDPANERYLSVARDIRGITMSVSQNGGVEIESNAETIAAYTIDANTDWGALSSASSLGKRMLKSLIAVFENQHFTFMEINPYIVDGKAVTLMDLAVEVDDATMYLGNAWGEDDLRNPPRVFTDEELAVSRLNETSPASFSLQVINPNGSIAVLLSGGGASVVIVDEVYSSGYGTELINYGEYSGNPTEDETFIYTSAVIRILLKSTSKKKVIFLGGAVANFTDIAKTFAGVIRAFDEFSTELSKQRVKVVVRRGGPHQEQGLENMRRMLEKYNLLGDVYDQHTTIGEAVSTMLEEVKRA